MGREGGATLLIKQFIASINCPYLVGLGVATNAPRIIRGNATANTDVLEEE